MVDGINIDIIEEYYKKFYVLKLLEVRRWNRFVCPEKTSMRSLNCTVVLSSLSIRHNLSRGSFCTPAESVCLVSVLPFFVSSPLFWKIFFRFSRKFYPSFSLLFVALLFSQKARYKVMTGGVNYAIIFIWPQLVSSTSLCINKKLHYELITYY